MLESGSIVRVEDGVAEVRFIRSSACAKCGRCGLAGEAGEAVLSLAAVPGLSEGDTVTVELPEQSVLTASLIAYGVPLVALVAGAMLGPRVQNLLAVEGSSDIASLIGALTLTLASFGLLRWLNPRFAARGNFSPRIVAVLQHQD